MSDENSKPHWATEWADHIRSEIRFAEQRGSERLDGYCEGLEYARAQLEKFSPEYFKDKVA